jgi:hypothetical protein
MLGDDEINEINLEIEMLERQLKERRQELHEKKYAGVKAAMRAKHNVPVLYECMKIEWEDLMYRTYTPDFILPNGIIIETKGRFTAADRRKHLAIKKQHPNLDLRFVFESSKRKLSKGSKTTYASWCERHKFQYADRVIPLDWIGELQVGITTTEDNTLTDDDYFYMMQLAQLLCSAVELLEINDDFRSTLYNYMTSVVDNKDVEEAPKKKVIGKKENVIDVAF